MSIFRIGDVFLGDDNKEYEVVQSDKRGCINGCDYFSQCNTMIRLRCLSNQKLKLVHPKPEDDPLNIIQNAKNEAEMIIQNALEQERIIKQRMMKFANDMKAQLENYINNI
jgi:hypothetical protein